MQTGETGLMRENSKNSANFGRSSQNSGVYINQGVEHRASHGSVGGVASSASFAPKTNGTGTSGTNGVVELDNQELNDELQRSHTETQQE